MKLEFRRLDLSLVAAWNIARAQGSSSFTVVDVLLTSSDGYIGFGEASPVSRYGESADKVEAFLHSLGP